MNFIISTFAFTFAFGLTFIPTKLYIRENHVKLNCSYFSSYHFAHPLPSAGLVGFLAKNQILEYTSSSCSHYVEELNPESWRKLTTIPPSKQRCANTTFDMSHAGIANASTLTEHVSFARRRILEARHQKEEVLHFFKALVPIIISTNLLQLL